MMSYSIYDPQTGAIISTCRTSRDHGDRPVNSIDGLWDSNRYHVIQGVAVEKTPVWDQQQQQDLIRGNRNQLLSVIDRVNPVWYASLTTEQAAELAAYRQALLDVPQQSGFPDNVVWPQQPSWL